VHMGRTVLARSGVSVTEDDGMGVAGVGLSVFVLRSTSIIDCII
jgi:hypothetical protein